MTKQELENVKNLFGSEEEFRNHLSALIADNSKRLECRPPVDEKDGLFQTTIIDWDKEMVVTVTKIGFSVIEAVATPFDCIQNVLLRFKNFDDASAIFPALANIDPTIKKNMTDTNSSSLQNEGF